MVDHRPNPKDVYYSLVGWLAISGLVALSAWLEFSGGGAKEFAGRWTAGITLLLMWRRANDGDPNLFWYGIIRPPSRIQWRSHIKKVVRLDWANYARKGAAAPWWLVAFGITGLYLGTKVILVGIFGSRKASVRVRQEITPVPAGLFHHEFVYLDPPDEDIGNDDHEWYGPVS